MRQRNAAIGEHLDQAPVAQLVADVPADAENDDLPIELPILKEPLETARAGHNLLHWAIGAVYAASPSRLCCTRSRKSAANAASAIATVPAANISSHMIAIRCRNQSGMSAEYRRVGRRLRAAFCFWQRP